MMNVKLVNRGKTGEFILEGSLNSNNTPDVEKLLLKEAQRFDVVILNLAKLQYTTSAGLRTFLKLRVAMDNKGGDFQIINVCPAVMEVFELTGLAGALNIT